MSSSVTLNAILEKISSKDKDFRWMATSDLQNELSKDSFKTDGETERKLCNIVLQQLEDSSGDISALAVKCLGLLVQRVAVARVEEMLDTLCNKLLSGKKEQQRDIAGIGLKTVIGEISGGALATAVVKRVVPRMMEGMRNKDSFDVVNESLDITNEVINKFGGLIKSDHAKLKDSLLPQLDETRAGLRKRAIHCLGSLSQHLTDKLLEELMEHIFNRLEAKKVAPDVAHTYMQLLGTVSRSIGWRFGGRLGRAVPLAVRYCKHAGESDDELRELCLQALESFVLRSPHDAKPHLPAILAATLEYLNYDPNYADDMEEDEEGDELEEEDELSGEEYSDDEDMSWKVRRAAAKALSAILTSYPDLLADLYPQASPLLLARFREREENVKMDIFNTFMDLVRGIGAVSRRGPAGSPLTALQADAPAILKSASRQLKDKSLRTRLGVFLALKELGAVLPDSISSHAALLVPGIQQALQDKSSASSQLKIQALLFLRQALASGEAAIWQPHMKPLSSPVFDCVAERYYKVTAEALRVCEQMVHVFRADMNKPVAKSCEGLVAPLFQCVLARLSGQDQDQEVKECAIACQASALATLGDVLKPEVPKVLKILLERLRNEITRLAAVKALTLLAGSPLDLDLSPVAAPALLDLTTFLRKANRPLRQASLAAMEALTRQAGGLEAGAVSGAVDEAGGLVSDSDLMLAALSLRFSCTVLEKQRGSAAAVMGRVLPQAITLVKSPLLQGSALEALQAFFSTLVSSNTAKFKELLDMLLAAGTAADIGKGAQTSVAQCVAELCTHAPPKQVASTVKGLLATLHSGSSSAGGAVRLALLTLGEIGRSSDLSGVASLQSSITAALTASSEDIKSAASMALGGITLGNLPAYLPFLLHQIQEQAATPKQQYLLLKALNEVIVSLATTGDPNKQLAAQHKDQVLALLLGNSESEEECRLVVAECAGHLALLDPGLLPRLHALTRHASPNMRTIVVQAAKYCVQDKPHPIDAPLHDSMDSFLNCIEDDDRHVRKAAVQTLSSAAHHKPGLIVDHLGRVLPLVYQQTVIRADLIRTVDLGPFKHKIDDGLELRKAAFEAMDVLLDTCLDRIAFADFIAQLESGLKDHDDVKLPCHLLLGKLAGVAGGHVLAALDRLVDPLHKTLTTKLKSDAVKQELDRHEDMVRSCLRAIEALNSIPDVETCVPFKQFMDATVMTGTMAVKYKAIVAERAEAEGGDSMDLS
ncbi:hypothetical protein WJX72_006469 [[Myrmecia] bisecta]|uniref:TATA-binding protein interacting (TIP20) domain-containing protein n=1 Tax=[Myrmecia] bisecta TaxID=41462 RepID=A0AAW1Q826_9CHLO